MPNPYRDAAFTPELDPLTDAYDDGFREGYDAGRSTMEGAFAEVSDAWAALLAELAFGLREVVRSWLPRLRRR